MNNIHNLLQYSTSLSILYVEDDTDLLYECSDLFYDYFRTVDIAIDGQEGIEKYTKYYNKTQQYYDIVLTDIKMPKLNGIELVKQIYDINPTQHIIIISAHDEKEYLLELLNLGVNQFLVKPLELNAIIDTLYKCTKTISKIKTNQNQHNIIRLNNILSYNKKLKQLYINNKPIKLSHKETLFLHLLITNGTQTTTIQEIYNTLWGNNTQNATIGNLKALISRFRKKVIHLNIENIYGIGYKIHF